LANTISRTLVIVGRLLQYLEGKRRISPRLTTCASAKGSQTSARPCPADGSGLSSGACTSSRHQVWLFARDKDIRAKINPIKLSQVRRKSNHYLIQIPDFSEEKNEKHLSLEHTVPD
jgi:hypothetical protein